jgi:hypothetical protein
MDQGFKLWAEITGAGLPRDLQHFILRSSATKLMTRLFPPGKN